MSKVDPKLLQVFADVVDQGSFTRAADLRETDASYVTRQIKKLENSLGFKLLNRSTRAISLTDKGLQIYQHATELNRLMRDVAGVAESKSDTISGQLRVTSSVYLGKKFLLPAVERLCDQYPDVTIEVQLSDEQVDVIKDRYDLALRVWTPKSIDLIAKHLLDIRFMLVATPEFIDRYGLPNDINELSKLPAVAYGRVGHTNKSVNYLDSVGNVGVFRLNANLCINDDTEVEAVGEHGKRYYLATNYMAAKRVRDGSLVQLLPNITLPLDAKVSAVYPNRDLSPVAIKLIELLKDALNDYAD